MKKTNNNSGRWIAMVMVIAFLGINYFKSENEGGPQEQKFAKVQKQKETRAIDDKIAPPQNIEKLKYAYTGKWERNQISAQAGQHAFTPPTNDRNNIQPTVAAKKKDDKKKKKIAAKKKKANKYAKKFRGKSRFDLNNDGDDFAPRSYPAYSAYNQRQQQQDRTPSDDNKEKPLTLEEWLDLITQSQSISPLIEKYSTQEVTSTMYFSVASALLSSNEDSLKKLGFDALAQLPSTRSLELYAKHIDDEMSAETKAFAQDTLKAYNQPTHLRTLNAALNSSDSKVRVIAATLIKDITTTVLAAQSQSGPNSIYSEKQIEQFKALLTQSLFVINTTISTTEGDVRVSFDSARLVLVQFLG